MIGESRQILASQLFGKGISSEDGAYWKHSRNPIKASFSRSENSDIDFLDNFVERMIHLILPEGTAVDIQPLIEKLISRPYRFP